MKIVIALDSFKGSCSAQAACAAVAQGLRRVDEGLELVEMPVSDGGEGLLGPCGKSAVEGRKVAAAALHLALRSLRRGRVSDPARRTGHYRDGAKLWAGAHAESAAGCASGQQLWAG